MKKSNFIHIITLSFLFLCLFNNISYAKQTILVIQGMRVKPYKDVVEGLKSTCNCEIKKLILSETKAADIYEKIHALSPDIAFTIGKSALIKTIDIINNMPIIYTMVLNPAPITSSRKNITGVNMVIPPCKQLATLLKILPRTKTVGTIYNPENTKYLVKKAYVATRKLRINLIAKETENPPEVPALIEELKNRVDAFWMLPDITVIYPETIKLLLVSSLEEKIPILTFSQKYVELGALISVGIDPFDIGVQAGKLVKKVLQGTNIRRLPPEEPRKAVITINLKVAKKLGISINNKHIKNAKIIK